MKKLAMILAAIMLLSGCVTMVRGTKQDISVNTDPAGADVKFNNGESCTSPCTIKAKRSHPLQAVISKDECRQYVVNMFPFVSSGAMFMGVMGGFLDYWTGAYHDLQPNPVTVNLACGEQAEVAVQDERERAIQSQRSAVSERAHAAITPSDEARGHPNYEKDLYECDWYATSKKADVVGNALAGAAVGAGVSAAVGAIFGVSGDFVGKLAGAGALTTGLSSGVNAMASNNARYNQVMVQCMRDKGHHVY
ncbi:hypothetical protein [Nitrosomonas sp. Nm34]|uniref:hypothetical protein n=1 Tax=Nitrosomonas sp. Nm34 TaxID=1881055 RepID=UPI0008E92AB5|nr:hypothetical protein [Nitrosomonas sp. Nm34]SFI30890.1 hypothetical protein SAMN05428978_100536 [Nitrosomonas sp. Nm34]